MMTLRKNTLAFLAMMVFAIPLTKSNAQNLYDDLKRELQKELESMIVENQVPGITFSLYFDDAHQIDLAAGHQDKTRKTPMRSHDRMLSGSVGKIFFSTLALKMVQDRIMDLEDPVSKYLLDREWYATFPNHNEIKIINLLNHTSGLPRHLFQPEFLQGLIQDPLTARDPEKCIQSIANKPAVHPVGRGWAYSDTNYILLGLIIEQITGKDIYQLVQEEFIEPLGLDNTVPSNNRKIEGLSQGHIGPQNPFQLPEQIINEEGMLTVHPAFEWTGGGFATTPSDLTRMVKFIHESDYLNTKTMDLLTDAVNMATGKAFDNGYGLGSFIWSKMEDKRYGHSGFFPGYVSHVEYSKNRQYAIAIQVNDDGAYPYLQQFLFDLEKIVDKYLDQIDEEKIRKNFQNQEICWNNADIECYMEAYATTEPIQTASRGGVTYGYDNIISDYKKYFPKERMGKLHFDNIETRRLNDDLYFVTGRFNLKFPDREELARGWFSVNMKRINGKWFMITDHSS